MLNTSISPPFHSHTQTHTQTHTHTHTLTASLDRGGVSRDQEAGGGVWPARRSGRDSAEEATGESCVQGELGEELPPSGCTAEHVSDMIGRERIVNMMYTRVCMYENMCTTLVA